MEPIQERVWVSARRARMKHVWMVVVILIGCGHADELRVRDQRIAALEEENGDLRTATERIQRRADALTRVILGLSGDVGHLESDREAMQASLAQAQAALEELEQLRTAMSEELERASRDRGTLRADLQDANRALAEIRLRERQARARLATMRSMLGQLRAMIDAGHLRVRITRNRMVVELPEAVLFDSGRAEVKESGREVLAQLAPILNSLEGREFQIAGHTDNVPIRTQRYPSNWELSTARATSVLRYLVEGRDFPSTRVAASGYADTHPVDPGSSPEALTKNRRVEIVVRATT